MNHVTEKIIEEAITTTDPDIIGFSSILDAKDEENSERVCNIDHEVPSLYTIHTAVLPKPTLIDANVNSAITAMLDIVQPTKDDVEEDATYDKVYLMRNMPKTNQLFQCCVNQMSQLSNGLTTKHYSPVPFRTNSFLLKVFLLDCQLNKIGNIFLSIMMVNLMILCSLLTVSINCSVHVAFVTWLESLAKAWLL